MKESKLRTATILVYKLLKLEHASLIKLLLEKKRVANQLCEHLQTKVIVFLNADDKNGQKLVSGMRSLICECMSIKY